MNATALRTSHWFAHGTEVRDADGRVVCVAATVDAARLIAAAPELARLAENLLPPRSSEDYPAASRVLQRARGISV